MTVRRPARNAIRRALRRHGLDVVRYDVRHFPELRRARLLREREVDVLLDVGANDGTFARSVRSCGFGGRIHSFEPQSEAFAVLAAAAADDPAWTTHRLGLGSARAEGLLHVAGNSSSSSLLQMAPRHLASAPESRTVATETIEVATLDELGAHLFGPLDRAYLKVDVQGAELDVLRGAHRTLERAEVVDLELSFVALYEGAPLATDVLSYLQERSFAVVGLYPVLFDPRDDALLQADAVLVRSR